MALPTDDELAEAGALDAGHYLLTFEEQVADEFGRFVRGRKQPLDRAFASGPRQPIARCVDHLMHLIARVIEANTSRDADGAADLAISASEALNFAHARTRGDTLKQATVGAVGADGSGANDESSGANDNSGAGRAVDEVPVAKVRTRGRPKREKRLTADRVVDAYHTVSARLLEALAKVEIFREVPKEALEVLRDNMVEAPFAEDEFIFEQGDQGDAFYCIISGTAHVLRTEEGQAEETILAQLNDGAVFGERSLLRSETRYASVKATSALKTMSLTRIMFERLNLQELVPDTYKPSE